MISSSVSTNTMQSARILAVSVADLEQQSKDEPAWQHLD